MSEYHRPIMVNEVLEGLNVKDGGVYFDGTAGGGGHSFAILASNPTVRLIATDKDGEAIAEATKRLEPFRGRFRIFRTDFKNYAEAFDAAGVEKIDGFLRQLNKIVSLRCRDGNGRRFLPASRQQKRQEQSPYNTYFFHFPSLMLILMLQLSFLEKRLVLPL